MARRIVATGFEGGEASPLGFNLNQFTTTEHWGGRAGLVVSQTVNCQLPEAASSLRWGFVQRGPIVSHAWLAAGGELGRVQVSDPWISLVVGGSLIQQRPAVDFEVFRDLYQHHFFEVRISPSGWVRHWIDGYLAFSYDGPTGTSAITTLRWTQAGTAYLDDFYADVTDEAASPGRPYIRFFRRLLPVSDGASSQWWGSDGNAASNYLLVRDLFYHTDTTWVNASLSGLVDSYVAESAILPIHRRIEQAGPLVIARKTQTADQPQISLWTASGASRIVTAPSTLETYARFLYSPSPLNPWTGSRWRAVDLSGIVFGITSCGAY